MSDAGSAGLPNRVRLARVGRGLSQLELARAAGVTRQAIAGIESGRWDPSLKVALALARALGTEVDELFGHDEQEEATIEVEVVDPSSVPIGVRVSHAYVGERCVALPLVNDDALRAGFAPASGIVAATTGPSTASVQTLGQPPPTLVIAGCDPAIPLLAGLLTSLSEPVGLLWIPCGSARALELVREGKVHAAGAHLFDPSSGEYNSPHARAALTDMGAEVVGFAIWQEGLVVERTLAGRVAGLSDAASFGVRLVNREKGSEARNVLDRELARLGIVGSDLPGYESAVSGHLLVASAIASGLAGAGIANEAAAATYGLPFVPMVTERYDLVIPTPLMATREVSALLKVLGMPGLRRQLGSLPGYDASICGDVADVF